MEDTVQPLLPPFGSLVKTACKGVMQLEEDTPHTVFRGHRIYFCLPECLTTFDQNPSTSCLAGDPLLESE